MQFRSIIAATALLLAPVVSFAQAAPPAPVGITYSVYPLELSGTALVQGKKEINTLSFTSESLLKGVDVPAGSVLAVGIANPDENQPSFPIYVWNRKRASATQVGTVVFFRSESKPLIVSESGNLLTQIQPVSVQIQRLEGLRFNSSTLVNSVINTKANLLKDVTPLSPGKSGIGDFVTCDGQIPKNLDSKFSCSPGYITSLDVTFSSRGKELGTITESSGPDPYQ